MRPSEVPPSPSRRRRLRRIVGVAAIVAAGAAGVALAAMVIWRTAVVEMVISRQFSSRGVEKAEFSVARVGLDGMRIENIHLGPDVKAASLEVFYTLAGLSGGTVEGVEVAGLDIDVSEPTSGFLATFGKLAATDTDTNTAAAAPAMPPIRVIGARIHGAAEAGSFSARLDGNVKPDLSATFAVVVEQAGTRIAGHDLHARKINAAVTLAPDAAGAVARIGGGSIADTAAGPWFAPLAVAGTVAWRATALEFDIVASTTDGHGRLKLSGAHDLPRNRGTAAVELEPLNFEADGLQPGDVVPALKVLRQVTGALTGDMEIWWRDGDYDGNARLVLDGLSFAAATAAVEGLSGSLRLDSLNPPAASDPRTLRARRIVGAIVLDEPILRFRFENAGDGGGARLFIERATAGFAGGRLSVADTVIGTAAKRIAVKLSGIDLGKLMDLLGVEGVSGSGTLSGVIPLEFSGDTVLVTGGLLETEGGGVLRFRSEAAKRALAAGGEQVELLLGLLEDFRYRRLSLAFDKAATGEATIRLGTEGHNPAVRDGYPFVLNVNLSANLDRVLATILEGYRLSNRAIRATMGPGR